MDLFVARVDLDEAFHKGGLFGLPFVYIMLVLSLYFSNARVVADDLFDSCREGGSCVLAFEFG